MWSNLSKRVASLPANSKPAGQKWWWDIRRKVWWSQRTLERRAEILSVRIFPTLARSSRIPLHQPGTSLFPVSFYFFKCWKCQRFSRRGQAKKKSLDKCWLSGRVSHSVFLIQWAKVGLLTVLRGWDYTVKTMSHLLVLFFWLSVGGFSLTHS